MDVGISTACFYPLLTEDALDQVLEQGAKTVEIFFNTYCELKHPFIDEIDSRLKNAGARIRSIHPFTSGMEPLMFFSVYERRVDDMIDFYKNYFEAAAFLGADILVVHGDRLFRVEDNVYIDRFARLAEVGKSYGVRVAQENVNLHRSASVRFIAEMRRQLCDLAYFVFDIKQAVRAGIDPLEMLETMGERLIHIHANDNMPEKDCMLPGAGMTDYKKIAALINEKGLDPDWIIEVYRHDYQEYSEIGRSLDWLRKELEQWM